MIDFDLSNCLPWDMVSNCQNLFNILAVRLSCSFMYVQQSKKCACDPQIRVHFIFINNVCINLVLFFCSLLLLIRFCSFRLHISFSLGIFAAACFTKYQWYNSTANGCLYCENHYTYWPKISIDLCISQNVMQFVGWGNRYRRSKM